MHNFKSTLRYQTGVATFVQLAVTVFLVVINNMVALFGECKNGSDCAVTAVFSMIFIIVTAIWFLLLSAIGYAAEERRSRNFAYLLIAGEIATAGIAFGFYTHPANLFGQLSALAVIIIAIRVSFMALRIARSRGGRIVARSKFNKS